MKKLLIIILTISNFNLLFAENNLKKDLVSEYNISFGIFNKIAKAKATLQIEQNKYLITMNVKAKGMAKFITNNRQENYLSRGFVKNGILFPEFYQKIKMTNSESVTKKYRFNYKTNIIELTKLKNNKIVFIKKLDYFAKNDILSLFFNIPNLINDYQTSYSFKAIGAMKEGGKLTVEIPSGKKLEEAKKLLNIDNKNNINNNNKILLVILNQKIFGSDKGELIIHLDNKNLCQKAILKDVIFFGDIVGENSNN